MLSLAFKFPLKHPCFQIIWLINGQFFKERAKKVRNYDEKIQSGNTEFNFNLKKAMEKTAFAQTF